MVKEKNGKEVYQAYPLDELSLTERKSISKVIEGTLDDVLAWMEMHKQLLN